MKTIFFLITIFIINGCITAPELSFMKGDEAEKQIEDNKVDATKAQEEYANLMEQRRKES